MKYQHRFRVSAPLQAVREFHSRSASMGAITPPPIVVRVHQAPEILEEGDEMDFTLWLGPLPMRWLARIEDVTPAGFLDRQVRGPMGSWQHRHSFVPIDASATEVVDDVELTIRPQLLWGVAGLGMTLGMPVLFAFRGWKTRRLLEGRSSQGEEIMSEEAVDVQSTNWLDVLREKPAVGIAVTALLFGLLLAAGYVLLRLRSRTREVLGQDVENPDK